MPSPFLSLRYFQDVNFVTSLKRRFLHLAPWSSFLSAPQNEGLIGKKKAHTLEQRRKQPRRRENSDRMTGLDFFDIIT